MIECHLVNKTSKPILHSHTHHKCSQAQVLHRRAWVKCRLQVPHLDGSAYRQCTYIRIYVRKTCTYVRTSCENGMQQCKHSLLHIDRCIVSKVPFQRKKVCYYKTKKCRTDQLLQLYVHMYRSTQGKWHTMIRDMASLEISQDSPKVGLGLVVISFKTTHLLSAMAYSYCGAYHKQSYHSKNRTEMEL